MAGNKITYILDFKANMTDVEGQLNRLKSSLMSVAALPLNSGGRIKTDLEAASLAAIKLERHLSSALNPKTGRLDLSRMATSMAAAGDSVQGLSMNLLKAGDAGKVAFMNTANAVVNAQGPIIKTNKLLSEMWTTMKNTARWQISSAVLNGLISSFGDMVKYTKDLNSTLTDIRIVTGESKEQMAAFAKEANKAAKALSTTTNEFAKANLIYRQQGDSAEQAMQKAIITTKAANVSFESSAHEMSDYLTALWNSYDVASNELELYVDKLVKVGAVTATSSEEMATSMEKVAAAAHETGVEYDQLLGVISTVSSTTRQSAEQVGTAFKTIFARMTDLKLEGSIDDEGVTTTLGDVSGALESIGVKVFDTNGQLRGTGDIVEDLGNKWASLDKNTQSAIAQVVAGKRQYTQLFSLFGQWDMYKKTMQEITTAQGELNKQNAIYQDSLEAARNRTAAKKEDLYATLINDESLIDIVEGFGTFIEVIDESIEALGGIGPVLLSISGIMMQKFAPQITQELVGLGLNVAKAFGQSDVIINNYINKWVALIQEVSLRSNFEAQEKIELNTMSLLMQAQEQMTQKAKELNLEEQKRLQILYDQLKAENELRSAEAKKTYAKAQQNREIQTTVFNRAVLRANTGAAGFNATEAIKSNAYNFGDEIMARIFPSGGNTVATINQVSEAWDNLSRSMRTDVIERLAAEFDVGEDIVRNYIESLKAERDALIGVESATKANFDKTKKFMTDNKLRGSYVNPETGKKENIEFSRHQFSKEELKEIKEGENYNKRAKKAAEELLKVYEEIEKKKIAINKVDLKSEEINRNKVKKMLASTGAFGQGKSEDFANDMMKKSSKDIIKAMDLTGGLAGHLSNDKASKELTSYLQALTGTKAEGKDLLKVLQDLQNQLNSQNTDKSEKELEELGRKAEETNEKLGRLNKKKITPEGAMQGLTQLSGSLMTVGSSLMMVTSSYASLMDALSEENALQITVSLFMMLGSAISAYTSIMPVLTAATKKQKEAQDASNKSMLKNPYIWGAAIILGVITVLTAYAKAHSAAAVAEKKHEKALENLQKAQEKASNYESEINSLEDLQKRLEEAQGDKKALAEITNELNAATGREYDLLDGGSEAYNAANERIKQMIENKERLKEIEEDNARSAAYAAYTNQTIESDTKGWFTTGEKHTGLAYMGEIVKQWNKLSKKEQEEYMNSGNAFSVTGSGINDENYTAGNVQKLIADSQQHLLTYFSDYLAENANLGTLISGLVAEGEFDPKKIEQVLKAFSDDKLVENISLAEQNDAGAKKEAKKQLESLKNKFGNYSSVNQYYYDEIASIQEVTNANKEQAKALKNTNLALGDLTSKTLQAGRDILKTFSEGFTPDYNQREEYIANLRENQGKSGLTEEEIKDIETSVKNANLSAVEFAKIHGQVIEKVITANNNLSNLTEENIGQLELYLSSEGVVNAKEMARHYLDIAKLTKEIKKSEFDLGDIDSTKIEDYKREYNLTEETINKVIVAEQIFARADLGIGDKLRQLSDYMLKLGQTENALYDFLGTNYWSNNIKDYQGFLDEQEMTEEQFMTNIHNYYDYLNREEQKIQLSGSTLKERESAQKEYNEKIQDLHEEELEENKEYAKEKEELMKRLKEQEEEWLKTDAIEDYKEALESLLGITERMKDSLSKYDFEESLAEMGSVPETADSVFNRIYSIGKENEEIATTAKKQLEDLLAQGIPAEGKLAQDYANTIQTLYETWKDAELALRENNLSAAMTAQIENHGERLAQEMQYVEAQQSLMSDLIEINKKSAYFAQQGREAILSKMLIQARGQEAKSKAVQDKEEENKEIIKLNRELQEEVSEINEEALEKDIQSRNNER